METKDKLNEVIRRYAGGNQRVFCRATGIAPPALNRMLKGHIKVSQKYIDTIRAAYPSAADYLDGVAGLPHVKSEGEVIEDLQRQIAEMKEELERKNRIIDAMLGKI